MRRGRLAGWLCLRRRPCTAWLGAAAGPTAARQRCSQQAAKSCRGSASPALQLSTGLRGRAGLSCSNNPTTLGAANAAVTCRRGGGCTCACCIGSSRCSPWTCRTVATCAVAARAGCCCGVVSTISTSAFSSLLQEVTKSLALAGSVVGCPNRCTCVGTTRAWGWYSRACCTGASRTAVSCCWCWRRCCWMGSSSSWLGRRAGCAGGLALRSRPVGASG